MVSRMGALEALMTDKKLRAAAFLGQVVLNLQENTCHVQTFRNMFAA